jgi:nucleotide-binding universal stress UspA family protein
MKLILALDGVDAGNNILDEVLNRPWPAGSEFRAISVVEPDQPYALSSVREAVMEGASEVVRRAAARLHAAGLIADGLVVEGNPKAVILEQADTFGADLILLGARAGTAIERFLLGSVSLAVIRHATCSVEVVRWPVRSNPLHYKVLLAVDGSAGSNLAAETVARRPWSAGTEIRVLTALDLNLDFLHAAFGIPILEQSYLEPHKEQAMLRAQETIRSARELLERANLTVSESISILLEPPKKIILDEAEQWGADLIVLGSHGKQGIGRFLLGSTSEAVATHAKCSVEVVRS